VQFGVDEHSNLLSALARVFDAREVRRWTGEADGAHPAYPLRVPVSNLSGMRSYDYVPGVGAATNWYSYKLNSKATGEPAFEVNGLADYSLQMLRPEAEVLKTETFGLPKVHTKPAQARPASGITVTWSPPSLRQLSLRR
jgi:hypothetical protein